MKILVAVLGARTWPYPWLAKTSRRTWASVAVPEVTTLFYYGGAPAPSRRGSDVLLSADDMLGGAGAKTVAFFEYALEHLEFDLLFRPNSSSYVDLPGLKAYAELHARPAGYYAGFLGEHDGLPFAGGAGYFLSRDLVEIAAAGGEAFEGRRSDDQALAEVLDRHGVGPVPLPRRDLTDAREIRPGDTSFFHFRCKTDTLYRHGDVRIMFALHRAFLAERGRPAPRSLGLQELPALAMERTPPSLVRNAVGAASTCRSLIRSVRR